MKKKTGELTVFLGCQKDVLETMILQGIMQKEKGKAVYIGCIQFPNTVFQFLRFQKEIDSTLHLEHVYQNNPEIVLIDGNCMQLRMYEDIQKLLDKAYNIYICINAAVFQDDHIQSQILDQLLFQSDHVFFLDEKQNNKRLYQIAQTKYLKWLKQKDMITDTKEIDLQEHILVCISSSLSCQKVIKKAFDLALNCHGKISGLYVSTSDREKMTEIEQKQLQSNFDLAEKLGIKVEVVYAENIASQIIQFAKSHHVSQIVVGKSQKRLWKRQSISYLLALDSKEIDIYIVPVYEDFHMKKADFHISTQNFIFSLAVLAICTIIGFVFFHLGFHDSNIIMLYILGVFFIAVQTASKSISMIFSLLSVVIFNFFFTFPTLSLSVYETGYPITFLIMFIVAFATSNLASRIQQNALFSSSIAKRTKILLETNQMLQKEMTKAGIIQRGCKQLHKLLNRDVIFYAVDHDELGELFVIENQNQEHIKECFLQNEIATAKWVIHHEQGGASSRHLPSCKYLYLSVRINKKVYGIVGIYLNKDRLDSFENDILLALLGEIAFALEIEEVKYQKNQADLKAENEQLRADLLRSISHDLRTPLTSISGNADILMTNGNLLTNEHKQKLYADIYDDSQWLINLVENLLSITRIEDRTIQLKIEPQIMEDVITEALEHVSRKKTEHHIDIQLDDELLMANMDACLIIQVIINIVNNAIKYTPPTSHIMIHCYRQDDKIFVEIQDDGPGIPDDQKQKIFEKFYSIHEDIVDGKRSMGLGLALCQTIIHAHGGTIEVLDCYPHGAMFKFSLSACQVDYLENKDFKN